MDWMRSKNGYLLRLGLTVLFSLGVYFFMQEAGTLRVKDESYDISIGTATFNYPFTTIAELQTLGFSPTGEAENIVSKNPELEGFDWSMFAPFDGVNYHGNPYEKAKVPQCLLFEKEGLRVDLSLWNFTSHDLDLVDTPVFYYGIYMDEPISINGKTFVPNMTVEQVKSLLRGYDFFLYNPFPDNYNYHKEYPYLTSRGYGYEGSVGVDYEAEVITYAGISSDHSFSFDFNERGQLTKVVIGRPNQGLLVAPMQKYQGVAKGLIALCVYFYAFIGIEGYYRIRNGEI